MNNHKKILFGSLLAILTSLMLLGTASAALIPETNNTNETIPINLNATWNGAGSFDMANISVLGSKISNGVAGVFILKEKNKNL